MNDPIIKEVRKYREDILQSYGSLRAYHHAIMEQQKQYSERMVSLPPKKRPAVVKPSTKEQ